MANRRPDHFERELIAVPFDHPSVTATTTWKFYKVPPGKKFQLTRATYINRTGLAGDGTNAFNGDVKISSTVMATLFNTDTGDAGGATLAADTFVVGVLSATATAQWGVAADEITLVATLEGAQTLPAGRVLIEGYLY